MKPASRLVSESQRAASGSSPLRLVLQIQSPRKRVLSTLFSQDLVVGRVDPDEQTQPDIDLTPLRAEEAGVSRFHVRFSYKEDTLYVEDLGSTNGTRINGFELAAGKSYRLMPSDEIELGSLRLTAQVISNARHPR